MIQSMAIVNKQEMTNIDETIMYMEPRPRVKLEIILEDYHSFNEKCEKLIQEVIDDEDPSPTTILDYLLDYLDEEGINIQ